MPDADHRLFLLTGAALFVFGFHGLLAHVHLLRRVVAFNIMGSGVFMVFIALAARGGGPVADPVSHAMVLTGIVVSACATAFALVLADCVQRANGRAELDESGGDDDQAPPDQAPGGSDPP